MRTWLWPLTVDGDMTNPLTPLMAQMLQEDARRAGERRAALLESGPVKGPAAHVNPRRPRFMRRLFRTAAEPAPVRLD
jgi:hypothetical protein